MKEGSAKLKAPVPFATTAQLSAPTLKPHIPEERKPRYLATPRTPATQKNDKLSNPHTT